MKNIVLFVILIPVIVYLVYFAYKKNTESAERADVCLQECTAQGYPGHEFRWDVLSGPKCSCFGEQQPI